MSEGLNFGEGGIGGDLLDIVKERIEVLGGDGRIVDEFDKVIDNDIGYLLSVGGMFFEGMG